MSSPPVFRLDHVPTPTPSTTPRTPAIAKLQSLLRQFIRVSTTDGRIFIGTFAGTDKLLNIILTNAEEYRVKGEDRLPDGRYVSLVMIPWAHVASVEAPKRWTQEKHLSDSPTPSSMYF